MPMRAAGPDRWRARMPDPGQRHEGRGHAAPEGEAAAGCGCQRPRWPAPRSRVSGPSRPGHARGAGRGSETPLGVRADGSGQPPRPGTGRPGPTRRTVPRGLARRIGYGLGAVILGAASGLASLIGMAITVTVCCAGPALVAGTAAGSAAAAFRWRMGAVWLVALALGLAAYWLYHRARYPGARRRAAARGRRGDHR
jgi:hypothetical protein